jgi:RNA-directed DNA polymerase
VKTEGANSVSNAVTVPAMAKQTVTNPAHWAWVDRTIWTERMLAALGNGVKGNKWFSLIDKVYRLSTLADAWQQVKANKGAAGVDHQSVQTFANKEWKYLAELGKDLQQGTYQPQAVRRVEIPKAGGKTRPLGIPCVKDRIVQTAVKRVIEPIFEAEFLPMSYGFRPGRGCKDALRQVSQYLRQGYTHVVDADLQGYFDNIPHARLQSEIAKRISDTGVLELLTGWLNQDIVKGMQSWKPTAGTPQGAVISPLLANLYLHPLDQKMTKLGYKMVRYADDFVILCQSASQAHTALQEVKAWVEENGLNLHPDKTHIGNCLEWGQGFDFLGYRFEAGKRWVRNKSLKAFKDKVREKTKRSRGDSIRTIVDELSPIIRGWWGYFKHAHPTTFTPLDGFIRRRLRAILRKQEKRPGMGICYEDCKKWPNVFFANMGLFTMVQALKASQPR